MLILVTLYVAWFGDVPSIVCGARGVHGAGVLRHSEPGSPWTFIAPARSPLMKHGMRRFPLHSKCHMPVTFSSSHLCPLCAIPVKHLCPLCASYDRCDFAPTSRALRHCQVLCLGALSPATLSQINAGCTQAMRSTEIVPHFGWLVCAALNCHRA